MTGSGIGEIYVEGRPNDGTQILNGDLAERAGWHLKLTAVCSPLTARRFQSRCCWLAAHRWQVQIPRLAALARDDSGSLRSLGMSVCHQGRMFAEHRRTHGC